MISTNSSHSLCELPVRSPGELAHANSRPTPRLAVIWIDWYAYHIARFRALVRHPELEHRIVGIELVGGAGVHGKWKFRSEDREDLPITTLVPDRGWSEVGQRTVTRQLWRKLNELNPDAVLIPGYYTLPALGATLWARIRGKRVILMSESTRQDHSRKWFVEALKRTVLSRLFHGAISGGKRTRAYLRELGFPEAEIAGLYDVVDNEFFSEQTARVRERRSRASLGLPENYFLYVGRMAPEKNVDGLIRAFARYRQAGGTWSLVLVGDGPLTAHLLQETRERGLTDAVHFAGLKDTSAIAPYYAFASCFVLASAREPWGLVVNEAMAAGLPLIVSDRCGCVDDLLEHGRNGFRYDFSAGDEQLQNLLSRFSALGENERRRMSQISKDIISKYSPELWAEEVVRIAGIKSIS